MHRTNTFDEERREMLEAILQTLAARNCSSDRAGACFDLLEHLARIPYLPWATIASSVTRSRYVS